MEKRERQGETGTGEQTMPRTGREIYKRQLQTGGQTRHKENIESHTYTMQ